MDDLDRPQMEAPPPVEQALRKFEEALGGRNALIEVLTTADANGEHLMNLLTDPRNKRQSLANLCSMAGLNVRKFFEILKTAKGAKAMVDALSFVYDRGPEVAADMVTRALPTKESCYYCEGKGQVTTRRSGKSSSKRCPRCDGRTYLTTVPDHDRQVKVMQMLGALKQPGGDVNVNTRVNQLAIGQVTTAPKVFHDFLAATDKILYGNSKALVPQPEQPVTVDAEVVVKAEE